LQASPNLMPLIGDLYFKYRDFPGHLEIAKRLKKMAPPEIRDEHEEIDPQQVLAQMEQMKAETGQIIEQMTAQMQEMTKTIEQKVIEQQGAIQKAQIDAQARVEVARIQADAQMRVADVKTTSGDLKAQLASETALLASQRQTDTKMQVELLKQMATRQENTPATTVAITVNADDDDDTIDEAPSRREDA